MPAKKRTARRGDRQDDRGLSPTTNEVLGRHDLLSREEEIRLGQRIRLSGDREALNKLVRHNIRFAMKIARRYMHYGVELDDLIQQANLGLIEAAENFEPAYGYRFLTYARWHILNRVCEELNKHHLIRRPVDVGDDVRAVIRTNTLFLGKYGHEPTVPEIAQHLGYTETRVQRAQEILRQNIVRLDRRVDPDDDRTVGDLVHDTGFIHPEVFTLARNELNLLTQWFARLKKLATELRPIDQRIFLCRYGLDDDSYEIRSIPTVAKQVGLPNDRVQRRIQAVIRWLWFKWRESKITEVLMHFEVGRAYTLRAALTDHSLNQRVE